MLSAIDQFSSAAVVVIARVALTAVAAVVDASPTARASLLLMLMHAKVAVIVIIH